MASTGVNFALGQLVRTQSVELNALEVAQILSRHSSGDWGEVDKHDWNANNQALQDGSRLLSAYTVRGTKIWVITEADRSVTTVLLPSDY